MNAIATPRTMTVEQFRKMLASAGWSREQGIEIADNRDSRVAWIDGEEVTIPRVWGWAGVDHAREGVLMQYVESWSYDEGDSESFTADADGLNYPLRVSGVTVEDDGFEMSELDIFRLIQKEFPKFIEIDYSSLKAGIEAGE